MWSLVTTLFFYAMMGSILSVYLGSQVRRRGFCVAERWERAQHDPDVASCAGVRVCGCAVRGCTDQTNDLVTLNWSPANFGR